MAIHKNQRIMLVISLVLFAFYTFATFFADEIVYDITSPCLTLSIFLLIIVSLPYSNRYRRSGQMFAIGVFFWFVADIFWMLYNNVNDDELLINISSQLYLMPELTLGLGLLFYLRRDFGATVFARFAINSFMMTAVFLMFIYKAGFNKYIAAETIDINKLDMIVNLWMVVFTTCALFSVFSASGFKEHTKAGWITAAAIILYNILEASQIIHEMMGLPNESIYADILFVFSLLMIGIAFTDADIANRDPMKDIRMKAIGEAIKIMWINTGLVLGISFVLMLCRVLTLTEFLFVAMITLVYVVMYKNVQTTELINELLVNQKDENARLEKLVEEKTKELQGVNHYLEMVSNTDELTGLHNRRYGMSFVDNLTRDDLNFPFALYSLDLNYFKPINDNYGHDMGDMVLKEVADRLKNIPFERCTPFRIGGDEFIVVYNAIDDDETVEAIAKKICEMIDEPIICEDKKDYINNTHHMFTLSTSVGVALYPDDTKDIDMLFIQADRAMYSIKHTHEKSAYKFYRDLPKENLNEQ
ncbi:MAG: GGDEF domain-containing protein [Lachnospiraceae bacterium]|nr:GGDEF domain-containing protein [Lachnospiraceae bacterium]